MNWQDIEAELSKKLDGAAVKSRSQAGQNLSYIEGHHAIREANRIFGFGEWNQRITSTALVQEEQVDGKWRASYTAAGFVLVGDVTREDVGFGQGIDKDKGKAHESAIKEAVTDMLKRCLRTFGDPFGLALYDKTQEHVDRTPAPRKGVQESIDAQAPSPTNTAKSEHFAEEAKKILKKVLKDSDEFRAYTTFCTDNKLDWDTIALESFKENVTNLDELLLYASSRRAA